MRRPLSVDGFTSTPMRRPPLVTGGQRPVLTPTSFAPTPPPPPARPPAPPPIAPSPPIQPSPVQPTPPPERSPLQFTPPPPKKRLGRRLLRWGSVVLLVGLISGGVWLFFHAQARQNDPTLAFSDALAASLSSSKLRATITAPDGQSQVQYDFSSLTNPLISNQATIRLAGSEFKLQTYGSTKSSYISYQSVPQSVNRQLSQAVAGAWVQLRAKGIQAPGVSAQLANIADPRYLAFGPVTLGNYAPQTRAQLIKFLQANKVYDYSLQSVTTKTLNGHKVFAYPVKLNIEYLKIAHQSAATSNKFTTPDMQAAITALDSWKGATATFYVTAKTHRLQQIDLSKDDRRATYTYDQYDSASLPGEPQTKLTWQDFARQQWQMESQLAAQQSGPTRDAARQAQLAELHRYLAVYFIQNNNYPPLANLNDQTWVAANLGGIDPAFFRDPDGTTLLLGETPKAGSFAYQPLSADGKPGCANTSTSSCAHYKLTAILSNVQPYSIQDP